MNRNSKKGFTIVELIIVIAVIAVLAAVLIPTFSNLIQKANEAEDTALVSNLNKGLKMSSKDFATMHEALQAVEENVGVDVEKISAVATDSKILWDSVNNCFVYLKSGDTKPTYIPDSQKTTVADNEQYKYWEIVETARNDAIYSQYLAGDNHTEAVTVNTGFDAGKNANLTSVKYENSNATQEVVIRTNGGTLEVNANEDTVKHYGNALSVNVKAIADNSYHVYGKVGFIQVVSGRVVVESSAKIVTVYASENTAKIDNNNGSIENAYAATGVTNTGNIELSSLPEGKTIDEIKSEAETKSIAVAKVGETYQISLEAAFSKALSVENAKIEIISDIDMSAYSWKPIDIGTFTGIDTTCKTLTIEGNSHTIFGLNVHVASTNDPHGEIGAGQSNYYGAGLFGRVASNAIVTINNITFDEAVIDDSLMNITDEHHTSQVAVVVGRSSGSVAMKNVNVTNSSVLGGEKVAALIGHSASQNNSIEGGSVVNTTIIAKNAFAAQGIGYVDYSKTTKLYQVGTVKDLELSNNNVSIQTDTIASCSEYVTDSDGKIYYNDGDWNLCVATVAYRCFYSTDTNGDIIKITLSGKTQNVYGSDYQFTKVGNKYSLV